MNILFFSTNDYGFGGSEDLWIKTAIHLQTKNHKVTFCINQKWQKHNSIIHLSKAGVEELYHSNVDLDYFHKEILSRSFDIVCVSLGYHLEGLDIIRLLVEYEIKHILVIHLVHELGYLNLNKNVVKQYRNLHQKSERIFFVCRQNQELYERMLGYRCLNASIVRNTFNVKHSNNIRWCTNKTIQLATVGRVECFHKGLDILVEAISTSKWRDTDFALNVFGEGPHKDLVGNMWEMYGLDENKLVLHGFVDSIESVWERCHVLLQPSRFEGLPLSVVEAALCSRPILATNVGGINELVVESLNGHLADYPNVKSIKAALNRLYDSKERYFDMGLKSREIVNEVIPFASDKVFGTQLEKFVRESYSV